MADIVYLSPSTIPSRTANSIHVMRMCQAFAREGHDVVLIGAQPTTSEKSETDPFSYYDVEPVFKLTTIERTASKVGSLAYWCKAAQLCRRLRPTLVYARDIQAANLIGRRMPVILELHELELINSAMHYKWAFSRLTGSPSLRHLIAISQALADAVEFDHPRLRGRVLVAHDGADPVANTQTAMLLDRPKDGLLVGYVGNLYRGRGLDLIVALAERLPWIQLHLAGSIADGREDSLRRLKKLPNITVHGHLRYKEAERLRMACDVLVAPYEQSVAGVGGGNIVRWMSPLKLFEYMAAGKAIVCSDIPVLREILDHGHSALLCRSSDIDDWCDALIRLRFDLSLRQGLGERALLKFQTNFTWQARARRVLEPEF